MSELNSPSFSIQDFLFIIFFKIHVIIGVAFIIIACTTSYIFTVQPIYSASGTILLKPLYDSRKQITLKNQFDIEPVTQEDINTEIKIFTSRELAFDVIEKLDLTKDDSSLSRKNELVSYVRGGLDVSPVTMSHAIRVAKEGNDPEEITKILNVYLECFIDRHIEVHKSGSGVSFYKKQVKLHEDELKNMQLEWSTVDIIDSKEQEESNIELLMQLNLNLTEAEAEVAEHKEKIVQMKQEMKESSTNLPLIKEFRSNDGLTKFTEAYATLLVKNQKIIDLYPANSIERKDVRHQLKFFQGEMADRQKTILRGMAIDLKALEKKKASIVKNIDRIIRESKNLAKKKPEEDVLLARFEQTLMNYKRYMDLLENARIAEERNLSGVANVSILSRAYKPSTPYFPKKKIMLLASIVAGSIAGFAAGFAAYYLDHTVKQPKELEMITGNPVLASIKTLRYN